MTLGSLGEPLGCFVRACRTLVRWLCLGCVLSIAACRQPARELPDSRAPRPPASSTTVPSSGPAPIERVRLAARHKLGVPLHPAPGATEVSGRLPDGAVVDVVAKSHEGRWLQVATRDGVQGWLTRRYLNTAGAESRAAPPPSVWDGRAACLSELELRPRERDPDVVRFMSYNLRWFPDGIPGKRAGEHATDIEWLACAIAASRVDVVLLQEIKTTDRARRELAALMAALNRHTGGSFEARLDPCPIETSQHVGLMYDASRLRGSHFQVYPGLNPHGDPCRDQLRPGFGGYLEFPGGLDLHVISVHFKSGEHRRDHELRLRSLAGLGGAVAQATNARFDDDIVVGGDLNTMGCAHCSPAISAAQEIELFRTKLAQAPRSWALVGTQPGCSEYHRGAGVLLDHFVVSAGLFRTAEPESQVAGYCADLGCRAFHSRTPPAAYRSLSDHCPVVLELLDRDDDSSGPSDAPRP